MSDSELASAVWEAAKRLNDATGAASEAGLRVEYRVTDYQTVSMAYPRPMLNATVSRTVISGSAGGSATRTSGLPPEKPPTIGRVV